MKKGALVQRKVKTFCPENVMISKKKVITFNQCSLLSQNGSRPNRKKKFVTFN